MSYTSNSEDEKNEVDHEDFKKDIQEVQYKHYIVTPIISVKCQHFLHHFYELKKPTCSITMPISIMNLY